MLQLSSVCHAEIKEFSASATYTMSNYETLDIAQQRALREAERSALEQAGIYIESHTTVIDGKVVNDEVLAVASNVIRIKSKKFDKYFDAAKNLVTSASIVAEIDTDKVDRGLKRDDIAELTKQYNILKETYKKQEKELEDLKRQKTQSFEMEQAMKRIDNKFLASEKIAEINKLLYDFDEAIQKNTPKYDGTTKPSEWLANVPVWKTIDEEKKKRRNLIIDKCNELIKLDSENSNAYLMRGIAYENYFSTLSHEEKDNERNVFYGKALEDYTKAISINSKNDEAYFRRARILKELDDADGAVADYTKVVEINPQKWQAYEYRARIYCSIGNYEAAIRDYTYVINNLNWNVDRKMQIFEYRGGKYRNSSAKEIAYYVIRARADLYKEMNLLNEAICDYSIIIDDVYKNKDDDLRVAMVYTDRAEVYLKIRDVSRTISDCNYVISSSWDKIKGRAYYLRAVAEYVLKDENKAKNDLDSAWKYGFDEYQANQVGEFLSKK